MESFVFRFSSLILNVSLNSFLIGVKSYCVDVVSVSPKMSAFENTFKFFKVIKHTLSCWSPDVLKNTCRTFSRNRLNKKVNMIKINANFMEYYFCSIFNICADLFEILFHFKSKYFLPVFHYRDNVVQEARYWMWLTKMFNGHSKLQYICFHASDYWKACSLADYPTTTLRSVVGNYWIKY